MSSPAITQGDLARMIARAFCCASMTPSVVTAAEVFGKGRDQRDNFQRRAVRTERASQGIPAAWLLRRLHRYRQRIALLKRDRRGVGRTDFPLDHQAVQRFGIRRNDDLHGSRSSFPAAISPAGFPR